MLTARVEFNIDMKQICQPLLAAGITFFDYARMYDDGSCVLLSNRSEVITDLFKMESPVFAHVPEHLWNRKIYYLIPERGPYQKTMHEMRMRHDLAHGFDMFESKPGYVEVCCFASSPSNEQIVNYYLNNIDRLENFRAFFKETAAGIISAADKQKITLPEHMRLNFCSGSYKKGCDIPYTEKELQVARLLVRGKTAREIASILQRSPRTIEHHIEALKNKTGALSKSELIEILLSINSNFIF
jgi:DNA-binding CsgD family transcriptional regulator